MGKKSTVLYPCGHCNHAVAKLKTREVHWRHKHDLIDASDEPGLDKSESTVIFRHLNDAEKIEFYVKDRNEGRSRVWRNTNDKPYVPLTFEQLMKLPRRQRGSIPFLTPGAVDRY